MAAAYSNDLRCRILQAYERGGVTLKELAKRFEVSVAYTKKIHQQQLRTGKKEREPQARYGPVSRVTAAVEAELQAEVRRRPDATLAELGQELEQAQQLHLSRSQLWRVLVRLGLRLKKNAARGRARQRSGS